MLMHIPRGRPGKCLNGESQFGTVTDENTRYVAHSTCKNAEV